MCYFSFVVVIWGMQNSVGFVWYLLVGREREGLLFILICPWDWECTMKLAVVMRWVNYTYCRIFCFHFHHMVNPITSSRNSETVFLQTLAKVDVLDTPAHA